MPWSTRSRLFCEPGFDQGLIGTSRLSAATLIRSRRVTGRRREIEVVDGEAVARRPCGLERLPGRCPTTCHFRPPRIALQTARSLSGFEMSYPYRAYALTRLPKIISHLQAEPHLRA